MIVKVAQAVSVGPEDEVAGLPVLAPRTLLLKVAVAEYVRGGEGAAIGGRGPVAATTNPTHYRVRLANVVHIVYPLAVVGDLRKGRLVGGERSSWRGVVEGEMRGGE